MIQESELIRVLHFYKTSIPYSFGGVEQVIHQLCSGGAEHDIVNEVLTLNPDGSNETVEIDGYKVHRVKENFQIASTGFSLSAFKRFKELAEQADIIHYHFPWPFMDLVHVLMRIKKPAVVSYHSDIVRQKRLLKLYRPLKRYFFSKVDYIVTASPNYLASSDILNRYQHKTKVITYGLNRNSYAEPTIESLEKWKKIAGEKFFLFLGVLRYYKGLHILLDALAEVDYPVVIAGSGPIESELFEHAKRLDLKNIHFVGKVSEGDKVALLLTCYGVVFPSHLRSEAFGISLLEGAMYGKPMISSEIGTGTTYINIDNKTGIVVPPSDSIALREAMTYLWNNEEEARQMGKNAEARYWELFTADKMVESYATLYRELHNRRD